MISQTLEQMIYLGIFSMKASINSPEDGNSNSYIIVKLNYPCQFLNHKSCGNCTIGYTRKESEGHCHANHNRVI